MANSVKFMNEGFNKLFGITEEKSDNTKKISNKKTLKESLHKKMNESTYRGVPNTKFIWHGTQSDPEIAWVEDGCEYIYNYYDIENTLWDFFVEETGKNDDSIETEKEFSEFCKKELPYLISDLTPNRQSCDESLKTPNYKKIHEMLTKMDEASMSDEDRKENDLLRSIYSKRMNRANAKLTSEEQAVLDKYGLYTDFYKGYNDNKVGGIYKDVNGYKSGVMTLDRSRRPADIQRGIDDTKSHGANTDTYATIKRDDNGKYLKNQNTFDYNYRNSTRREKPTKQPDQINYVDRARKLDDRVKTYQNTKMDYFDKNSYTYDDIQQPGVKGQRDRINKEMQSPLYKMKGALNKRKEAQTALDNAKDVYDKATKKADDAFNNSIANAIRRRDSDRDRAKRTYDIDSNPKYRDAAQAEIDSLLKKNK